MPIEYGALLAMHTLDSSGNTVAGVSTNETAANFYANVDEMVNRGLRWVRMGLAEGELLIESQCAANALVWDEYRLSQIDSAMAYVKARGMNVFLLLGAPVAFTTTTLVGSTAIGATSFTVGNTSGFRVGQTLIVGDNSATPSEAESLTVATIAGATITTTAPATKAHAGAASYALGATTAVGSAAFTFTTVTGVAAGQVFLISGTEYFTVASVAGSVVTMTAAATIAHPSGGSADRQGTVVSYGQGDYINGVVTPFYGTLANRWSNLVAVWQCWNEANLGDFRGRGTYYNTKNFTPGTYVPGLNSAYLSEFQVALSFARTAIRAHSLAPITTNAGSTVAIYHSTVQTQFLVFFGAIYPYLDGLSLDMYDGMDPSTVATSVGYLRALQTNFAKPLYISEYGEFGIAGDPTYTEALQAQIIPQQMAGLAQANPLAIILYRYADNDDAPFEHNEHLGLKRADGTHKPAFDTFFAATLPPAPTIVSITPSSAGTTTGGQATITGTNFFVGRTVVTFGGSPSPLVTVVADTTLTCLIPAHDATGSTLLAVTTPGGTASRADLFAYTFSPPAVGTSTGIVTYATNAVIGMQDVGAGALVAHIYAPAPLGTADDLRTHIGTLTVADGDVVMSQANRFDGHDLTFQEGDKDVVNALVLRAQMDLEEDGLGIVARGLVVSPKQAVTENGDGTVTVHLDNLTTELDQTNLGLRYVDRQEIGQIVRNMGNAQTAGESVFLGRDGTGHALTNIIYGTPIGWRADYLDDRTIETSAAPVQWNPNAGDNLGGVLVDLVANGNSVRRDVLIQTQYLTPSACGVPAHDDATQPWEMTYQIVVPTDADAGINQYPSPGYGVQFGFRHGIAQDSAGVWTYSVRVIDGYTVVGGLVVPANTRFKVALDRTFSTPRFLYSIQRPTDPVFSLVYAGGAAAQLPYYPAAVIRNAGGEVSNATIVHDVPMSRIWWAVNYNSPSNLGGLIQLAQDTGMFVRQAIDAITATPQRAMEFGPLGENSGITLVSVNGADINRLKTNPRKRIIREVTEYASVDNTVTVLTPLGGGTDPAQLDLARCFLMLNDPTYVNYGAQNFPEYDPDYTIHMLATYGGGPEYYIRYEPAFVPGGVGEIRGQPYINQELAYPPDGATIAEQELAARTLYAAAVVQLQAGMRPRVTFSATLVGYGRPPRAGSKVAVDYTHLGAQQIGIRSPETFIPLRITTSPAEDGLWRVLQVSRHYGQGEPVDTVVLSSSGRYGDAIEAATGEQRQQIAIQVVGKTTSVPMMASLPLEPLDAANPIVHSFHIDESCYRITKARFRVRFGPYMQPVRTSKNPSGTPVVATGAVPILLPTPADINLSGTFNTAGTGVTGTTDGFDLVQKGQDNDAVVKITVENDGGNLPLGQRMNVNLHTPGGVTPYYTLSTGGAPNGAVIGASMSINFTKAKTQSAFTAPIAKQVAAKDTTIAHIPAGTVLANEPQHVHDVDPDLHALTNPTQITVQIDSGDGLFVDRSVQVSDGSQTGPWTGDFIFECSRFFGGPGRDVQVRFSSTDNADHGRGGLRISYTLVGEYQSAGTEGVGV